MVRTAVKRPFVLISLRLLQGTTKSHPYTGPIVTVERALGFDMSLVVIPVLEFSRILRSCTVAPGLLILVLLLLLFRYLSYNYRYACSSLTFFLSRLPASGKEGAQTGKRLGGRNGRSQTRTGMEIFLSQSAGVEKVRRKEHDYHAYRMHTQRQ